MTKCIYLYKILLFFGLGSIEKDTQITKCEINAIEFVPQSCSQKAANWFNWVISIPSRMHTVYFLVKSNGIIPVLESLYNPGNHIHKLELSTRTIHVITHSKIMSAVLNHHRWDPEGLFSDDGNPNSRTFLALFKDLVPGLKPNDFVFAANKEQIISMSKYGHPKKPARRMINYGEWRGSVGCERTLRIVLSQSED